MITWSDFATVSGVPIAILVIGLIAFNYLVYLPIVGQIRRSSHPIEGAGHVAKGCGITLVWGVVLAVVCLGLYVYLRAEVGL